MVEHLVEAVNPVRRGGVIAAVETQKGTIEIGTSEDGVLDSWIVPLGRKVPVGTPIAMIRASDVPDPVPDPEIPQPADPMPQVDDPAPQPENPVPPAAPQEVPPQIEPDTVPPPPEDIQP